MQVVILPADLRFALRRLVRSGWPGVLGMLMLALGMGGAAAIFSVIDAALLRPLPFRDPARLVFATPVRTRGAGGAPFASAMDYLDYRDSARTFGSIAAMAGSGPENTGLYILKSGRSAEYVASGDVSYNFFATLGVKPLLGRDFEPADENADPARVVALSYSCWRQRFHGESGTIGRVVTLDGAPATIVAVMPAGFDFPHNAQIWIPMPLGVMRQAKTREIRAVQPIARLRAGISLSTAQAEVDRIAARLAATYPQTNAGLGLKLSNLQQALAGDTHDRLWLLFGAALCVLLIACFNTATLQLANAAARGTELAVRVAIGAGTRDLARQLLFEALVLSTAAGLVAVAIAAAGSRLLVRLAPPELQSGIGLSPRVLLLLAALGVVATAAFGIAPLREMLRSDIAALLKTGSAARRKQRAATLLTTVEIALSFVLAAGALLLAATFRNLETRDIGFDPSNTTSLLLTFPPQSYPQPGQIARTQREILRRVRAVAGVQAAAIINRLPMTGATYTSTFRREDTAGVAERVADLHWLSPGALDCMHVALLGGRQFTDQDIANRGNVILINQKLADTVFPGENALGRYLRLNRAMAAVTQPQEIIGIVRNVQHRGFEAELYPSIYRPSLSTIWVYLLVRTNGPSPTVVRTVQREVQSASDNLPRPDAVPLQAVLNEALAPRKFQALLFSLFGALALVLACGGVFGIVAYSVEQRLRDYGIRMALGAQPARLVGSILTQAAVLAAAGIALGLLLSFAARGFMSGLLFGIQPLDARVLAGVAGLLVTATLAASFIPARRAARVDPVIALKT